MRRPLILAAAALLIAAATVLAQQTDPDAFVKTVRIGRIYTHPLGYRIIYLKSGSEWGEMYIPIGWFSTSGLGKAEAVWGNDPAYPYLSIYYANGKFERIRLYLRSDPRDPSWGTIDPGLDLSKQFSVQEPPKEF